MSRTPNLTLVAFESGYTKYFHGGDIDFSYDAECRIFHPTNPTEAAQALADLQIASERPRAEDRREWEITILFNGRESADDEELSALEEQLTNLAYDLRKVARERVKQQALAKEAAERERQRIAAEQIAKRRAEQRETQERKELIRLKAKYESSL